jgi:hypothetical protein
MLGYPAIDRPNLNQMHREAGAWTEYALFYSGYRQHVGDRMQVILATGDPIRAYEALVYVRREQQANGVTPDAVLKGREVVAGRWSTC